MTFTLPEALRNPDDEAALRLLRRYYGDPVTGAGAAIGAAFDDWDSTGTRLADADRFVADDLVAVSLLSVRVPGAAAVVLLRDRADEFAELLGAIGPDRDLVDEAEPLTDDKWPGWRLQAALRTIDGIDTTIATKLIARKRPRLRPIWDRVVAEVTGARKHQWEPLRAKLQEDDRSLQRRLIGLHAKAGLPEQVSPLRIFDVIAWREGKDRGL
ncbi:DUF6308 family protein [Actinoplanes sp. CA-015351]|uniref:DUF6308 family protein n=1 Tax=Actinoplanes sp. CA-015351 TaxID=3239897 RepID=UPI003D992522